MTQTFDLPPLDPEREASLRTIGIISYVLHAVVAIGALLPGVQASIVLLIVAVIVDLVKRDDAAPAAEGKKPWVKRTPDTPTPPGKKPWVKKPVAEGKTPWAPRSDAEAAPAAAGDKPWKGKPHGKPQGGDRPWAPKDARGKPPAKKPYKAKPGRS